MDIQNITDKLPKHATKVFTQRPLAQISHIAVHHSTGDPHKVTVEGIARYHVDSNGWAGIGYHYCITVDGSIYQVNDLEAIAAHVYGHNGTTVGVCLIGDFTKDEPPDAQRRALAWLLAHLHGMLGIPLENVKGHRDFPGQDTSCPGDSWIEWGMTVLDEAHTLVSDAPRLWSESEIRALIAQGAKGGQ